MRQWLTYGGKAISDFNVYISGNGTFDAAERDRKSVTIPGRNGELTLDNGRYKNIKVKYPAYIAKEFKSSVEGLRNYLLSFTGYERLEDTYHPNEYRLARYSGDFNAGATKGMRAGSFTMEFDCMPQRFLKTGEKESVFTSNGRIFNPTRMSAKPLIYVQGAGTVAIGKVRIKTGASMWVDCDLMEAYLSADGSQNMNSQLTLPDGVFPTLEPGENGVGLSGVTRVTIIPRWWIL